MATTEKAKIDLLALEEFQQLLSNIGGLRNDVENLEAKFDHLVQEVNRLVLDLNEREAGKHPKQRTFFTFEQEPQKANKDAGLGDVDE